MTLNRSVLGRRPNFNTTRRATSGASQVRSGLQEHGGLDPANLSGYGPSTPRGGRASAAAPPGAVGMPASDTRLGYTDMPGQYGPASLGLDETNEGVFAGAGSTVPKNPLGGVWDFLNTSPSDIANRERMASGEGWSTPDHLGQPAPYRDDGSHQTAETNRFNRIKDAAIANNGTVEGLNGQAIQGAIDSAYAGFEADAARWRALRAEALADGEAETAAAYDKQIRDTEQQMDDLKREIQVAGDVESWYRANVEAPFIRARDAAANVDFQPTLDLKNSSVGRIDEEFLASNKRLDDVLRDIGFTPEQQHQMKLAAAEDNAVAAAQMEVLDATAMRPGYLAEMKNMMFHTADQLRYSELRQSAGNELVETEPRKRALDRAAEDLNFLTKERADAIARTRRAVERQYGEGPKVPDREMITQTALETMMDSLAPDLPPGQRNAYMNGVWELINAGYTEISNETIIAAYKNGLLPMGPELAEAQAAISQAVQAGTMTAGEAQAALDEAALGSLDNDDRVIFQTLLDTYQTAWGESEKIIGQRNQSRGTGADNTRADNIAAAKAGEGAYGERARVVADLANVFKDMGLHVEGANYFRPYDPNPSSGRAVNSDHLTAGALDIYLHVDKPEDMKVWRERVKPILDQWIDQGIVANYLPPGANTAHNDHAHVSFALPGTNDGEFTTSGHYENDGHDHGPDINQVMN